MPENSRPGPERSEISAHFERLVALDGDAVALVCAATGKVTTRRQLKERGKEIASFLADGGVGAGHALALQLPNSVDFIAAFLAALELGVTIVPLDRDAKQSEVAAVLQHFGLHGVMYHAGGAVDVRLPEISLREASIDPRFAGIPLVKLTSGSTGRPKGILTTERNLIADCANICASMGIGSDDMNFGAIPFSHSYGFSNLVTPLLLQGTAIVYSNDYLPLAVLETCNRFEITVVPGIPLMFEHLARLPKSDGAFETVRTFISAGAPLAPATSRRFRERYGIAIHTFYGCSECGGITYDREGAAVENNHVGRALEGVELTVDGELGRLVVRSGAVAAGYFDPVGDECRKFAPSTFVTDDIVVPNSDDTLTIQGRIGDLINTAGKKVNPREIEAVILQLAGVHQAKVWGEPAGARGEVVAAAVVADPDVSRETIRAHCRGKLSPHKVPRIVKLIEEIPVDERGKFKRSALQAL